MIRLFYAPPGWGKTSVMAAMAIERMYGEKAAWALAQANAEVTMLNACGHNVTPPKSNHLVYCGKKFTIDVRSPDFGHRRSLKLDPDRLGIAAQGFAPQYVYRGSLLCIDELPTVADSRNWQNFLDGMCDYWAKHRKHGIDMYATCQDISQVEKRIRMLAMITRVLNIEFICDKFGEVLQTVWQFQNWPCYEDWERGLDPTEETYIYNGDIRNAYDTNEGEEDFYIGLDDSDFSCEHSGYADFTPEGIKKYAKENQKVKKKKGAKQ